MMKFKHMGPVALLLATFASLQSLRAVTYSETGDAGDTPLTAQLITGAVGVNYSAISGTTTATNNLFDSDMFQITIATPGTYTFSTNLFVLGSNNFDTQLALFTLAGTGLVANDDSASGGELSTLTMTLAPGNYYLLISGSGRYAVDSTGALIFPNYTDGTTDPSATVGPNNGTATIGGYTGATNEGGKYFINITQTLVPEPGTFACVVAGAAGLALLTRLRRQAKG